MRWTLASVAACGAAVPALGLDSDGDGVADALDNCLLLGNPGQQDVNLDGFGNLCDGDYDESGSVDGNDFEYFLAQYLLPTGADLEADHDSSGFVEGSDFAPFLASFTLGAPGPSGLSCAGAPGCSAAAVDADADGVVDEQDNCLVVANSTQLDTNGDGFGNHCDPDYDGDGLVSLADQSFLVCATQNPAMQADADVTGDGVLWIDDYDVFQSYLGLPPGPSGLPDPFVDPTVDSLGDADADGFANYQDNCRDVANPGQENPDQDAFGLACDADYDQSGFVDTEDVDAIHLTLGTSSGDAGFDDDMDHDLDGSIGAADVDFAEGWIGLPPGPSGRFCAPLATSSNIPQANDAFIRLRRGDEFRGQLTAVDPNGDAVTFSLGTAPSEGTLPLFQPDGAFRYVSDASSTAATDRFEFEADDGTFTSPMAALRVEYWEPADDDWSGEEPSASALVVCNTNAEDALGLAQYYAAARGIDADALCPVELPNGLYASAEELVAARDAIVTSCVCPAIPVAQRPEPCDETNLAAVGDVSPIRHLVLMRGLPARLYGTGWPTDEMRPSLDYYLSQMLYDDEEVFAPGQTGLLVDGYAQDTESLFYRSEIDPALHRRVAYGRVEAITNLRTQELIDRTLAAEATGFSGALLTEDVALFDALRRRTASLAASCEDPVLSGTAWPSASCRTATTATLAGGRQAGAVPGEPDSTVPVAIGAGLFLGADPMPNGQAGFDGAAVLQRWHRSASVCTERCADYATGASQAACEAASADWFGELETSCVGVAPGAVGMQARSYTVTAYGFHAPGWGNGGGGAGVGQTPVSIVALGGFSGGPFADTAFAHFGAHGIGEPDLSTCTRSDASVVACPEVIALTLEATATPTLPLAIAGTRDFDVVLRYRVDPAPGALLRVSLEFVDGAGGSVWSSAVPIDVSAGAASWTPAQVTIQVSDAQLSDLADIRLRISSDVDDGIRGWIDLDGIEVIDTTTANSLLAIDVGGFAVAERDTHAGDWAANAIDRLGAVGWWGSSSHHMTGGLAFEDQAAMASAFLAGRTLGESVAASGRAESGILYGDPLYRPSAAALFFPSDAASKRTSSVLDPAPPAPLLVDADHLATYAYLYVNALHGSANTANTRWSLATCVGFDEAACDAAGGWIVQLEQTGAVREKPIDWTQQLIDPSQDAQLTVRLRVWNPGDEANALYDYVYLDYRAQ